MSPSSTLKGALDNDVHLHHEQTLRNVNGFIGENLFTKSQRATANDGTSDGDFIFGGAIPRGHSTNMLVGIHKPKHNTGHIGSIKGALIIQHA